MVKYMNKTVLITGSSSGIGKETALFFAEKGWNVIATMRNPDKQKTVSYDNKRIDVFHLDVTDIESIRNVIEFAIKKYSRIDVIVNNAGYTTFGPFEASTKEQLLKQFYTNVFGLMDVIKELLPTFRNQNGGVIINVASMGGRTAFAFYSLYNGSKWAVEGFSEALYLELREFNIKVKIIEPGLVKTDFYGRSKVVLEKKDLNVYNNLVKRAEKHFNNLETIGSHPRVVAKTIYKAATDNSWKLRYQTGKFGKTQSIIRKLFPDRLFHSIIRYVSLR